MSNEEIGKSLFLKTLDIPRGMSINLDAGQIFFLAREVVRRNGGSYAAAVDGILRAINLLKEVDEWQQGKEDLSHSALPTAP